MAETQDLLAPATSWPSGAIKQSYNHRNIFGPRVAADISLVVFMSAWTVALVAALIATLVYRRYTSALTVSVMLVFVAVVSVSLARSPGAVGVWLAGRRKVKRLGFDPFDPATFPKVGAAQLLSEGASPYRGARESSELVATSLSGRAFRSHARMIAARPADDRRLAATVLRSTKNEVQLGTWTTSFFVVAERGVAVIDIAHVESESFHVWHERLQQPGVEPIVAVVMEGDPVTVHGFARRARSADYLVEEDTSVPVVDDLMVFEARPGKPLVLEATTTWSPSDEHGSGVG